MPTAVEYDQMGDGSVHPPDPGKPEMGDGSVMPGGEQQGPTPHMNPGDAQGIIIQNPGAEQGIIIQNPGDEQGLKEVDPMPNPGKQGGENQGPTPHMNPGGEQGLPGLPMKGGEKGLPGLPMKGGNKWLNFAIIAVLLLFILFLGGVFGPPEFLAVLLNFTIPTDQLGELVCPSDPSVGDPAAITDGTSSMGEPPDDGLLLPAVQDQADPPGGITDGTSDGLLLPAVQKVKVSAFSAFMFDVFKMFDGLQKVMGMEGFLPPGPCLNLGSLPPAPPPTPTGGGTPCVEGYAGTVGCVPPITYTPNPCPQGATTAANPCDPPVTEPPAECVPGWLPTGGCTCCGSTLVCSDGSIGEFNPQCTGGGDTACTCVPNTSTAAAGTGYHCRETGAACTP